MFVFILSKNGLNHIRILGKPLLDYSLQNLVSWIDKEKIKIVDVSQLSDIKKLLTKEDENEDILFLPLDCMVLKTFILRESYNKFKKANDSASIFHTSTKKDSMIIKDEQFCFMWMKMNSLRDCFSYNITSIQDLIEKVSIHYYRVLPEEARRVYDFKQIQVFEKELENQIQKKWLNKGVYIEQPETVLIGPDVFFLGKGIIRGGTQLLGQTICYDNVVVGPNSEIKDSILHENVQVAHSVINQSSVGANTIVGPFAHLRNHTSIGENNRIGNFVEIKKSTTGNRTYASHLTYIGDTFCGNGVNFGCGVVTVNYDGKLKHSTWIGDNVFIGCNSNLIAPISIDSNSFIASGSTIVKNIGKDDFAIARAPQINKKNYAKKYGYKREDEA